MRRLSFKTMSGVIAFAVMSEAKNRFHQNKRLSEPTSQSLDFWSDFWGSVHLAFFIGLPLTIFPVRMGYYLNLLTQKTNSAFYGGFVVEISELYVAGCQNKVGFGENTF